LNSRIRERLLADGTISIPKEVILLALSYAIYASSRRGLISVDSKSYRFLPAGFAVDSRSFRRTATIASTRENALLTFYYIKLKYAISSVGTPDIALSRAKST